MALNQTSPLDPSWEAVIGEEFSKPYMQALNDFLATEAAASKTIYPPNNLVFNAFNHTPFEQVRVVIIGQDPYHGPDQAHGLSFSVPVGVKLPPSLKNIFKEIAADIGITMPTNGNENGDLSAWAKQGVLLLNATLTVELANAGSHQKRGWETFTDAAITALNAQRENLVFVLWGSYAQKKGAAIDTNKHLVLKSVHPSPLSAHRGFFGNQQFSQINQHLIATHQTPIDWQL
jgi:uracil-DNA glycosylase